MSPEKNTTKPARPFADRGTGVILIIFVVISLALAAGLFMLSQNFFATTNIVDIPEGPPLVAGATSGGKVDLKNPVKTPTISMPVAAGGPTPVPWDGSTRFNLLVMGLDYRDWESGADVPRTDTMIVFTIDPVAKTAGMISIPRDMWVSIPGFGYNRINTAYRFGEMYKVPGGGKALAMKTVEQFIGVPVNDCALIDFNAFVRFIDELGGLDMKIREPLKIDPIGPGNTRILEPGTQTLDGQAVLAYARNRYTNDGDFDRSKRQQEVIMAIRKQMLMFDQVPMMVAKAPQLYAELSSGINTTLSLDQIIKLAWLATQVKDTDIKRGVFDPHKDVGYATINGPEGQAQVLIPNPDQIRLLRDEVFGIGQAAGPNAEGSAEELVKIEAPKVALFNGGVDTGTASQAAEVLRAAGVNVVSEGPGNAVSNTTITVFNGKPYTVKYVMEKFGVADARVVNQFDPNAAQDVQIVIGSDWKNP